MTPRSLPRTPPMVHAVIDGGKIQIVSAKCRPSQGIHVETFCAFVEILEEQVPPLATAIAATIDDGGGQVSIDDQFKSYPTLVDSLRKSVPPTMARSTLAEREQYQVLWNRVQPMFRMVDDIQALVKSDGERL